MKRLELIEVTEEELNELKGFDSDEELRVKGEKNEQEK